ncbi:chemotaxis protein methyltransferase CheR [Cupriavidus gilardii J11]|uniref:Chemotaxis protein methyltransferase CheR n=1 Tax=Cupriavidus gilardii J11 TaxID=936133 RepID=A0A562BD61_9BURK|nr:CheR family methyltransferase [Cupriavidus gilardii]TWG83107.1 chemotaxis protein methyltransferase CheR [Cupriavidus gilardii J11]
MAARPLTPSIPAASPAGGRVAGRDSAVAAAPADDFDIELELLLEGIYRKYQHDFRGYSRASLRRRLSQALRDLKLDTLSQLQDRMLRDSALFTRLFQYLTVQVSEMFRDPSYFRALREQVVPVLKTYPSLKVWVAGCSSGEELWSLAILFAEEGLHERTTFYATDINPAALAEARAGVYDVARLRAFGRNYLAAGGQHSLGDYYHAAYGKAKFDASLVTRAVFADHSLATDSVFQEAQLISCRNVLIYFDRSLQDRALGLFRDALVRHGFLGLGSKESLQFSAHAEAFEAVMPADRLYRKR